MIVKDAFILDFYRFEDDDDDCRFFFYN